MFFLLCQVGTIVWFTLDFRSTFEAFTEECKGHQEQVKRILDYCFRKGFIAEQEQIEQATQT